MLSLATINAMNQLVAIHHRSLVSYLRYASPTWHRGDDRARDLFELIADQQREVVDRCGAIIVDSNYAVNFGHYPMSFTGYHDLGVDYMLDRVIEDQETRLEAMNDAAQDLNGEPICNEIAQEAIGMAKGHLDSLRELRNATSGV